LYLFPLPLDESRLAPALAGQERIELTCFRLGNRASLVVLGLVYVAVCLETPNMRSGRSGAVGNMALAAGRNTKSTAGQNTDAAIVSAGGPWRNLVALRVNPMPTSKQNKNMR
jgi:hypothetical protein